MKTETRDTRPTHHRRRMLWPVRMLMTGLLTERREGDGTSMGRKMMIQDQKETV
jgi:hypothetical protein